MTSGGRTYDRLTHSKNFDRQTVLLDAVHEQKMPTAAVNSKTCRRSFALPMPHRLAGGFRLTSLTSWHTRPRRRRRHRNLGHLRQQAVAPQRDHGSARRGEEHSLEAARFRWTARLRNKPRQNKRKDKMDTYFVMSVGVMATSY